MNAEIEKMAEELALPYQSFNCKSSVKDDILEACRFTEQQNAAELTTLREKLAERDARIAELAAIADREHRKADHEYSKPDSFHPFCAVCKEISEALNSAEVPK